MLFNFFDEQKTQTKAIKQRPERDDYRLLGRAEQVTIVRPRTGHRRLNQHMHQKRMIAPTPDIASEPHPPALSTP